MNKYIKQLVESYLNEDKARDNYRTAMGKQINQQLKLYSGCQICETSEKHIQKYASSLIKAPQKNSVSSIYDLHHIRKENKHSTKFDRLCPAELKELDKCIIVCPVCHRLIENKLIQLDPNMDTAYGKLVEYAKTNECPQEIKEYLSNWIH